MSGRWIFSHFGSPERRCMWRCAARRKDYGYELLPVAFTHGHKVSATGNFGQIPYGVDEKQDSKLRRLKKSRREAELSLPVTAYPKLLISKVSEIPDPPFLMVDMSHFAGLWRVGVFVAVCIPMWWRQQFTRPPWYDGNDFQEGKPARLENDKAVFGLEAPHESVAAVAVSFAAATPL